MTGAARRTNLARTAAASMGASGLPRGERTVASATVGGIAGHMNHDGSVGGGIPGLGALAAQLHGRIDRRMQVTAARMELSPRS